ncbi:hypothetical protein AB3N59_16820 [Leptospira sp. WS92.C1]
MTQIPINVPLRAKRFGIFPQNQIVNINYENQVSKKRGLVRVYLLNSVIPKKITKKYRKRLHVENYDPSKDLYFYKIEIRLT